MNANTKGLVEIYLDWLRENSSERDVGAGWNELTLPYLDRHNDFLQVYVREGQDGLYVTDEGRTIRDLKRIGCDLKPNTKRRALAEAILRGMGLDPALLDAEEITTTAVNGEFPYRLHGMLMSMLAIDGLANTSSPNVLAMFKEDVTNWLRTIGVSFELAKFKGRSGFVHDFDFKIPATPKHRDRVIHTLGKPDKMHIQSFIYEVKDTREALNGNSPDFLALFSESSAPNRLNRRALLMNQIDPWVWSSRNELGMKLVG